ncbi:MAG: pentapeptide repeat-containing protein [Desulfurellales bacterium]|nr:MAG: pentapeptide repeat-containing protein [Desulfurellales bacterium]
MTPAELKTVLDAHALWLRGDPAGKRANLRYTNLSDANLSDANLSDANLSDANLTYANLSEANLRHANLRHAKNLNPLTAARLSITPEGRLIGWKKCLGGVIVKLAVPEEARRSNATGRKCRAEGAEVLEVHGGDVGVSLHDGTTEYRVGQTVRCHKWCEDRWAECGGGIHFYLTREEAEVH